MFFSFPPLLPPRQSLRVIFELLKDCTIKPNKSLCCVINNIIIIETSGVHSLEGTGVVRARSQRSSLTSVLHAMTRSLN